MTPDISNLLFLVFALALLALGAYALYTAFMD